MNLLDFSRPLFLWGLLGILIPILIHLLGRRRVRPLPVATLRFLRRARAQAAARWRLRRLLLLLSRAAALGCLALLFAGPGCREVGRAAGPATWLLMLDTSPSMEARRGKDSSLDRAQAALSQIVDRADPRDRFLLVTTKEGSNGGWSRGFTADASIVRRALGRAAVEYGVHRADRAVERAFRLLEGVEGAQIVFATDLQASAWGSGPVAGGGRTRLRLVDTGIEKPSNAWIAGVGETGGALRVRVGSAGSGSGGVRQTVKLRLEDGQTVTAFTQTSEAFFHARTPPGLYSGEAALEPGGDLGLDDKAPFVARGVSKVRVLLVNGDPRGFELRDELFFVRRALAPGGHLAEGFQLREVGAADLTAADLTEVDVVVLANPGMIGSATLEPLKTRVSQGVGLIVAAGDRWRAGDDLGSLSPLIASALRDVISLTAAGPPAQRPHEPLDPSSFAGPLSPFRAREAGDLSQTRVWTYWVPEVSRPRRQAPEAEVLMRLQNGAPLLLDRPLGRGRTLLLTTTLDRDGSDLCLQPGFVPWLERLLLHAAGRLRPSPEPWVPAGRPLTLPYGGPVSVAGPSGFRADWAPGGPPLVPPVPGLYRISENETAIDAFAAGLEPGESDLTRLDRGGLDARLGPGTYALGDEPAAAAAGAAGRRDVSGRYALGLLAALAAEAALAARWSGRRRPARETEEAP